MSGVQFPPVSGQTAILVGRVATPVIPASGTQPVDQGWGKNYVIAKEVEAVGLPQFQLVTIIWGLTPLRPDKDLGISVETGLELLHLSRGKGYRDLKGLTSSATCTHGLQESDLVISLKPKLEYS